MAERETTVVDGTEAGMCCLRCWEFSHQVARYLLMLFASRLRGGPSQANTPLGPLRKPRVWNSSSCHFPVVEEKQRVHTSGNPESEDAEVILLSLVSTPIYDLEA